MSTIAAIALRLLAAYWRQLLAGLGVVLALWWLYATVYDRGYDKANAEWTARQQAAQAQAQADSWELVDIFAAVDASVAAAKSETAKSEVKFRDRIIRTAVDVYRDNPVCRPPDSLWRANDQYAADLAAIAKLGVVTVQPFDGAGQR